MKRFNQFGFIIIISTVFTLLLYKALHLPVVNDEAPTAVNYINFNVWQIMMYTDHWPNNHILNTLLVKLFVFLFGNHQLVIRLPNLLSFLVYAVGIFRINKSILKIESIFFLPAALFFVSNPYMLDYFGLSRGYGMASALATLSVSYLITGFKGSKNKHIWIGYLLSIIASYASFTLLDFWCGTSLMVLFYFFSISEKQYKRLFRPAVILFIISLLYLALIANPMIKMHSTNEFQYWSSKGFYLDTIYPFIEYSRSGSHLILNPTSHLIAAFIFFTIAVNCFFIFVQLKRSHYNFTSLKEPLFISTVLLLATACINILQNHILKTPNLHGRTALFLYPLFIIVFVAFLGLWPEFKAKTAQTILGLCFAFICIFHVADRYRLDWVRDWWHDSDTLKVMDYLKTQNAGKTVSLKTTWFCQFSFYYYVYTGKAPWLDLKGYDKSIEPGTTAEYYYLFSTDEKLLEPEFEPIATYGDRVLMKRRE
jgi:hypothetical protein